MPNDQITAETREADAKIAQERSEYWSEYSELHDCYKRLAHLSRHAPKVQEAYERLACEHDESCERDIDHACTCGLQDLRDSIRTMLGTPDR